MKPVTLLRHPFQAYILLTALYFLLVAFLPANTSAMAAYDLSADQYRILLFILVLPFVAIWFAAMYAYAQLRSYAQSIHKAAEGEHFGRLAKGVRWLAYGLPITAIVALVLSALANLSNDFLPTVVIINNYLTLLIPLVGFLYISRASRGLTSHAGIQSSAHNSQALTLFFMALGVIYCYSTFQYFDLNSLTSTQNPYYLPMWLMLLTVTIPFLYSWFVGLLSAYELVLYARHSQGVLYKQALELVGYGMVVVIASFIALQYINSVAPRNGFFSINNLLIMVYVFRFMLAAGFISIAIGAKKLKRIEEV